MPTNLNLELDLNIAVKNAVKQGNKIYVGHQLNSGLAGRVLKSAREQPGLGFEPNEQKNSSSSLRALDLAISYSRIAVFKSYTTVLARCSCVTVYLEARTASAEYLSFCACAVLRQNDSDSYFHWFEWNFEKIQTLREWTRRKRRSFCQELLSKRCQRLIKNFVQVVKHCTVNFSHYDIFTKLN